MKNRALKQIFLGCFLILVGVLIGRWSTPTKVKVEYVKGETIRDSIPYEKLVPYKIEVPSVPDTIRIPGKIEYKIAKVDTARIISEFIKKNYYEEILFDNDTLGMIKINSVVQYNRMLSLGYEYTPIQKQTTIYKKRVIIPFLTTSYNSFGYYGLGLGLYYNNWGFQTKHLTNSRERGFEFGVNYKF